MIQCVKSCILFEVSGNSLNLLTLGPGGAGPEGNGGSDGYTTGVNHSLISLYEIEINLTNGKGGSEG